MTEIVYILQFIIALELFVVFQLTGLLLMKPMLQDAWGVKKNER